MIDNPQKILVIKSEISELKKVESFLMEIMKEFDLDKKYFNKVYLCLSEAVINSIKHGNKNDKNKTVVIGASCDDVTLSIQIQDEGDGFNLSHVKDPTNDSNIRNESGRGIFIIKNISNKLEYNDIGNSVQFKIECK